MYSRGVSKRCKCEPAIQFSATIARAEDENYGIPTCIPNLRLDGFALVCDASRCELYSDRRLRLQVELISCEPRQKVGFTDTGVSDQHNLKKVIVLVVRHGIGDL